MSNKEILDKRWKLTDKLLKKYQRKLNELGEDVVTDLLDIVKDVDVSFQDLNKPLSKTDKKKLDKKVKEWKKAGLLTGYFAFLISSKRTYTYADMLEILIYGTYVEEAKTVEEDTKEIFTEVAKDIYTQALEEMPKKPKKTFSLTWEYIWSFLYVPTYNKNWNDYLKGLALTSSQEAYKFVAVNIQQETKIDVKALEHLVKKQNNRILLVQEEKYSGALNDTCRSLANKMYIEPFKEEEDLKARFIAEMDDKTTKMCEGLNNMIFSVNGWNKFYRYSDLDGKDVYYTVKGLVVGVNLPPIDNHFHWCRSTITYQV